MGLFGSKPDNSVELIDKETDQMVDDEIEGLNNIHKHIPLLQERIENQIKMLNVGKKAEDYILTKLQSKMDGEDADLGFPVKIITNLQVDYNIRFRDTAQIDMLMVTPRGLICFEIKNRMKIIAVDVKGQDIVLTDMNKQRSVLSSVNSPIKQNNIHIDALKKMDFSNDMNKKLLQRALEKIGSCIVFVDAVNARNIFVSENNCHVTNDRYFFSEIRKIYDSLPNLKLNSKDMERLCTSLVECDKISRRPVNLEKYQRLAMLCIELNDLHTKQRENGISGERLINNNDIRTILDKCTSNDYLVEIVSDSELSNDGKFSHEDILEIKNIIEKCKNYTLEQLKEMLNQKLPEYKELSDSYDEEQSEPVVEEAIEPQPPETQAPADKLMCFGCHKPLSIGKFGIYCKNKEDKICTNIKLGFVFVNGKRNDVPLPLIRQLYGGKRVTMVCSDNSVVTILPELSLNKGYTNWKTEPLK